MFIDNSATSNIEIGLIGGRLVVTAFDGEHDFVGIGTVIGERFAWESDVEMITRFRRDGDHILNNFQNLSWCGQVFGACAISGGNVGTVGR